MSVVSEAHDQGPQPVPRCLNRLNGRDTGLGTAWGHQVATGMLREAGFTNIQLFERVDPMNSLYVARP